MNVLLWLNSFVAEVVRTLLDVILSIFSSFSAPSPPLEAELSSVMNVFSVTGHLNQYIPISEAFKLAAAYLSVWLVVLGLRCIVWIYHQFHGSN